MLDSHCHLTHPLFSADTDAVIANAKSAGLRAILCIGTSASDSEKVLAVSRLHPSYVFPVLGLSPHDAPSADLKEELKFLEINADSAVAIGEIGLEYRHFREPADRQKQKDALAAQLQLAEKHSKPVQIHCRDAHDDLYAILADFPKLHVVMHCFYEPAFLEKSLSLGHTISVPTLRSKKRDKVLKSVPLERVHCETDSPFLWHAGRNEPRNVADVYRRLAEAKTLPLPEVEAAVDALANRLYKLW
ncbi:MAG: TatD family hydrolase [Candidatus Micrarchaeota archaeon]